MDSTSRSPSQQSLQPTEAKPENESGTIPQSPTTGTATPSNDAHNKDDQAPQETSQSLVFRPAASQPQVPGSSSSSQGAQTSDPGKPSRKVSGCMISGTYSYWSGAEQLDFARCLAHFGTDFPAIAAYMETKTPIMLKNHYHRSVANARPDLREAAARADARRARGEEMGAPPELTFRRS